jgi:hypothetical protein
MSMTRGPEGLFLQPAMLNAKQSAIHLRVRCWLLGVCPSLAWAWGGLTPLLPPSPPDPPAPSGHAPFTGPPRLCGLRQHRIKGQA